MSQCPPRRRGEVFKDAIPTFLGNAEYRFFVAEDEKAPGEWPPYAYGLLKPYREPFNEWDFLGLEAAWLADAEIESHLDVSEKVREIAADLNVYALCISEESIGSSSTFRAILVELRLSGTPRILLAGARPGVYSGSPIRRSPALLTHRRWRSALGRSNLISQDSRSVKQFRYTGARGAGAADPNVPDGTARRFLNCAGTSFDTASTAEGKEASREPYRLKSSIKGTSISLPSLVNPSICAHTTPRIDTGVSRAESCSRSIPQPSWREPPSMTLSARSAGHVPGPRADR